MNLLIKKQIVLLMAILTVIPMMASAQDVKVYNLRNCQGEMRTVPFQSQLMTFNWWVFGKANLSDQRVLRFSPSYQLDSTALTQEVLKVRQTLPRSFLGQHPFLGEWYNNRPDEPGIWFQQVYASKDKKGNFTVLAAVMIIFEGTDAHVDENRANATIKAITFIFNKKQLTKIARKLTSLPPL